MNPDDQIKPGYLTQPQATIYLNVSDGTLEEWIRTKNLPFYRPGWERRFRREDLDKWMESYKGHARKQRKKRTDGETIAS